TAGFALLLLLLCTWSLSDIKDKATINKNFFKDPVDLESIGHFVYSAYFDTRPTLNGRKYVRVITVLDTKAYEKELICQFMHQSGHLSFSTVAKRSAIGAGMGHKQHYYKEFVLSCPVADDLRFAAFVFIQTGDASLRSQVMRIINCVSVTFGKPDEYRLIEWLEAQRLLKMDKVQLHFYHMTNKNFESVAQAYSAEGFVNVRKLGCPFCEAGQEESLGLLLMSPAINQCFYENLGRYTYTAVFDLDEIIVPQQHPDYPTLLSALEKRANSSSFAFRNWYHFSELGEDSSVDPRMYMLRHPYSTKQESPPDYSIKSIHKSCCVVALHNHFSWEDVPKPNTKRSRYNAEVQIGVNEHYKRCHLDKEACKEMTDVKHNKDGFRLRQLLGKELTAAFRGKVKQIFGAS
uniref:Glycosyltransferase family 92 protein n=1 Tax=Macrostomum lignano TaxID=282301 RepID=A0A1I8GJ53_9PLAT